MGYTCCGAIFKSDHAKFEDNSSRSEEGRRPSERSEVYKFVLWGSREDCLGRLNLDLPIYISMVSAQLPSNKTKSRPLTVAHSHMFLRHVSSFLACFGVYIYVLICLFIVCEQAKAATPHLTSG